MLIEKFERECELMGWNDKTKDGYEIQQLMIENVKDTLEVISKQGHSGFSIGYFKDLLNKAIDMKPLSPLTGEDNEWNDISNEWDDMNDKTDSKMYQNKRLSKVFKENGRAYTLDYYVFKEPNSCTFTNGLSQHDIEFPYKPQQSIIIEVPEDADNKVIKECIAKYEKEK